jgi:hypothetical protein
MEKRANRFIWTMAACLIIAAWLPFSNKVGAEENNSDPLPLNYLWANDQQFWLDMDASEKWWFSAGHIRGMWPTYRELLQKMGPNRNVVDQAVSFQLRPQRLRTW